MLILLYGGNNGDDYFSALTQDYDPSKKTYNVLLNLYVSDRDSIPKKESTVLSRVCNTCVPPVIVSNEIRTLRESFLIQWRVFKYATRIDSTTPEKCIVVSP